MNLDLERYRRVHFVGIGGIGMSALARLLLARGYQVSGSDSSWSEQAAALAGMGAQVYLGHRSEQLDGAELVVVTSAVREDNPEVRAAIHQRLPVVKRAELLGAIFNAGRGIAVAGTHGKTTTSALIGHILTEAGLDPTILIGGISKNLGSNARISLGPSEGGKAFGQLVVAEADEYDASFLHLRPSLAVITNVEPEHLDFYRTVDRLQAAFREFARGVSDTLVVCADGPVLPDLVRDAPARVVTYGINRGDWRATDIQECGDSVRFSVRQKELEQPCSICLGLHAVPNALAAFVAAHTLGLESGTVAAAMASFRGVERRFDVLGEVQGVLVMDDYAHHPSEIRVTLRAIRERFRRPVRVVFQPHTYSRTRDFLGEFACAFPDADSVYLLDIYAARETERLGISGADLARAARAAHPHVAYTQTVERTLNALLGEVRAGDLVVTMGAGDVYQLGPRLLSALEGR